MNNKGFTLIELMISVSLVSVVLIFTLNLLNDLRAEESLGTDKTQDLTNRTIITKVIQNDLDNHTVQYFGLYNAYIDNICGFSSNVFESKYNFVIKKCIQIKLDDGCRAIMIGNEATAEERNKKPNVFAYGKRSGECTTINNANPWTVEKWKLSSANYTGFTINTTSYAVESNNENNLAGNLANYLVMIQTNTQLDEAYANTSMNFDLEFIYFTSDVNSVWYSNPNNPSTRKDIFYAVNSVDRQIKGINSGITQITFEP